MKHTNTHITVPIKFLKDPAIGMQAKCLAMIMCIDGVESINDALPFVKDSETVLSVVWNQLKDAGIATEDSICFDGVIEKVEKKEEIIDRKFFTTGIYVQVGTHKVGKMYAFKYVKSQSTAHADKIMSWNSYSDVLSVEALGSFIEAKPYEMYEDLRHFLNSYFLWNKNKKSKSLDDYEKGW